MSLTNPFAVVTGAANGIGRALARKCASQGLNLALIDRDSLALNQLETELRRTYPKLSVRTYLCDLSKKEKIESTCAAIKNQFREYNLKYLFNHAGWGTHLKILNLKEPTESYRNLFDTNFWSQFHVLRELYPLVLKTASQKQVCHIMNTGSIAGVQTSVEPYYMSKHLVVAFTEAVQNEVLVKGLGDYVKVHCLCPGGVETNMKNEFMKQYSKDEELLQAMALSGDESVIDKLVKPDSIITPEICAEYAWRGIIRGDFYIHTHYDLALSSIKDRFNAMASGKMDSRENITKALERDVDRTKVREPSFYEQVSKDYVLSKL